MQTHYMTEKDFPGSLASEPPGLWEGPASLSPQVMLPQLVLGPDFVWQGVLIDMQDPEPHPGRLYGNPHFNKISRCFIRTGKLEKNVICFPKFQLPAVTGPGALPAGM